MMKGVKRWRGGRREQQNDLGKGASGCHWLRYQCTILTAGLTKGECKWKAVAGSWRFMWLAMAERKRLLIEGDFNASVVGPSIRGLCGMSVHLGRRERGRDKPWLSGVKGRGWRI